MSYINQLIYLEEEPKKKKGLPTHIHTGVYTYAKTVVTIFPIRLLIKFGALRVLYFRIARILLQRNVANCYKERYAKAMDLIANLILHYRRVVNNAVYFFKARNANSLNINSNLQEISYVFTVRWKLKNHNELESSKMLQIYYIPGMHT